MPKAEHRCEHTHSEWSRIIRCHRGARFFEGGKWYCKPHAPGERQKKHEMLRARRLAEWAAKNEAKAQEASIWDIKDAIIEECRRIKRDQPMGYAPLLALVDKLEKLEGEK